MGRSKNLTWFLSQIIEFLKQASNFFVALEQSVYQETADTKVKRSPKNLGEKVNLKIHVMCKDRTATSNTLSSTVEKGASSEIEKFGLKFTHKTSSLNSW